MGAHENCVMSLELAIFELLIIVNIYIDFVKYSSVNIYISEWNNFVIKDAFLIST